jgi:ElaB/YqjD/DUF883 family membrane-anchored ribosome-binding protein
LVFFAAGACAITGRDRTDSTLDGLKRTRLAIDRVVRACADGNAALANLTKTPGASPRPFFESFSRQASILESEIADARDRNVAMHEDTNTFFQMWEQELGSVRNAEIKAAAQQRRAELKEAYAKVRTASQAAQDVADPFVRDLNDLRVYLDHDLSPAGIAAAKDTIAKIGFESETVSKRYQDLAAQIKSVEELLAASAVAAAK